MDCRASLDTVVAKRKMLLLPGTESRSSNPKLVTVLSVIFRLIQLQATEHSKSEQRCVQLLFVLLNFNYTDNTLYTECLILKYVLM
jgi:hypothetical protein